MSEIQTSADLMAEAVRVTFDSMSITDKQNVQAAILRSQRKAMAKQLRELRPARLEDTEAPGLD